MKQILSLFFSCLCLFVNAQCSVNIGLGSIDCSNNGQGSVYAYATGGNGPYTFVWSNGDEDYNADSLNYGDTLIVVMTDNLGCVASDTAYFPNPYAPYNLTNQYINNASCANNCCDGYVVFGPQSGNPLCPANYYIVSPYFPTCPGGDIMNMTRTYYTDSLYELAVGTYTVVVMTSCGCSYYWTCGVGASSCVSLNTLSNIDAGLIKVFPNPTFDMVTIQFKEKSSAKRLTMEDVLGKKVYSVEVIPSELTIDLSSLKKGLYLIKIYDAANLLDVQKVFKE